MENARARVAIFFIGALVSAASIGCGDHAVAPNPKAPAQGALGDTTNAKELVKFTPAALARLHEIEPKAGKAYLRVAVMSGGSTGFIYDMKFDEQSDPNNDYQCAYDGIQVVVDKRSSLFLEGATIDWQTTADGRQGFKFDNPNAVKQ